MHNTVLVQPDNLTNITTDAGEVSSATAHNSSQSPHRVEPPGKVHHNSTPSVSSAESTGNIDFDSIRRMCETNDNFSQIDCSPGVFKSHRISHWPKIDEGAFPPHLDAIYTQVKETGLPNFLEARIPLPTHLNIEQWEAILTDSIDDQQLLDFLLFGFPAGYLGPPSDSTDTPNHPSATEFPVQISEFVCKEQEYGTLIGPHPKPPFVEWTHVSPVMSRPKKLVIDRRVISDMTYPKHKSVNAYIMKNSVLGEERCHSLPKVHELVQELVRVGSGAYMSSLDIKRAYKNFTSDPLDWPLLCIQWSNCYYCDTSVPFGARASSAHMQRVADSIVNHLATRGIFAKMYLDDIVILSESFHKAVEDFNATRDLISSLGLPEAVEKAQPPAKAVQWLGVLIDAESMTISIPQSKIDEIITKVSSHVSKKSMTKKQLQSVIGSLVHVAKCVAPGRLFVSRLLDALRGMKKYININSDMRKDMRWFIEFASQWNGVGVIPNTSFTKVITVDACLTGLGGADEHRAYAGQVTPSHDGVENIAHLEAANVVVALHSLVAEEDNGSHIHIYCDNQAVVSVLTTGKGRDKVILDCARLCWMAQALLNLKLTFSHIPGSDNHLADALSRAHDDQGAHNKAAGIIASQSLQVIVPCTYVFTVLNPPICSRSGVPLVAGARGGAPTPGTDSWYSRQPKINSPSLPGLDETDGSRPRHPVTSDHLRVSGIREPICSVTTVGEKQTVPCETASITKGSSDRSMRPPPCPTIPRGTGQGLLIQTTEEAAHSHAHPPCNPTQATPDPGGGGGQGSHPPHVLRWPQTIRGCPAHQEQVRR